VATKTLLRLREVAVSAGLVPIVASASMEVAPRECVGISGPNGSGKTTLLRVLATLRPPDRGEGEVLGEALGGPGVRNIRPRISLLGHEPALAPELSLLDNLRFHARLRSGSTKSAEEVLETVGLKGAMDRRAIDCSAGMLRRADLARLFLHSPDLLLLDEPTDGLDQDARPLVAAAIEACLERDGAAVVVSHDASNLAETSTRIHYLDGGVLR